MYNNKKMSFETGISLNKIEQLFSKKKRDWGIKGNLDKFQILTKYQPQIQYSKITCKSHTNYFSKE